MRKTYEGDNRGDEPITSISEYDSTTLGVLQCFNDEHHIGGASGRQRSHTRSTQTSLSLPILRQVTMTAVNRDQSIIDFQKQIVLTSDGVHWINDLSSTMSGKSPDEVTTLVEANTEVRVMSDLGEQLHDEDDEEVYFDDSDVIQQQVAHTTTPL